MLLLVQATEAIRHVIIIANIHTGINASELIHRSPPVVRKRRSNAAGEFQFGREAID